MREEAQSALHSAELLLFDDSYTLDPLPETSHSLLLLPEAVASTGLASMNARGAKQSSPTSPTRRLLRTTTRRA